MTKTNLFVCSVILLIATVSFRCDAESVSVEIDKLAKKSWFSGAKNCLLDKSPAIEVYQFNLDTYILRQNKCVHYEAPFIYLLFGEERALIIDTGATAESEKFPLAATVRTIMSERARQLKIDQSSLPLVISHSHSHGDHIAADGQFHDFDDVEIIKPNDTDALISSFAFKNWPLESAEIDLGQRAITIIPTPGHQDQAITFYDKQTSWLLTGDSVYPGRLYIRDWENYRDSIKRLLDFTATHKVSAILGAHIEMSTSPKIDYPVESIYHPNEHSLVLTVDDLTQLNHQLLKLGDTPALVRLTNMIIYPVN